MEHDSFCDNCGKRVPFNATVCPYCRKEFTALQCPECGRTGNPAEFLNGCPDCGYMQSQDITFSSPLESKNIKDTSGNPSRRPKSGRNSGAGVGEDGAFSGVRNPSAAKPYRSPSGKDKKRREEKKGHYEEPHIPDWVTAGIIGILGVILFILFMLYIRLT